MVYDKYTYFSFFSLFPHYNYSIRLQYAEQQIDEPQAVKYIVVCGGYNDQYYSIDSILYAAKAFISRAGSSFQNAKIMIGMIGWNDTDM